MLKPGERSALLKHGRLIRVRIPRLPQATFYIVIMIAIMTALSQVTSRRLLGIRLRNYCLGNADQLFGGDVTRGRVERKHVVMSGGWFFIDPVQLRQRAEFPPLHVFAARPAR